MRGAKMRGGAGRKTVSMLDLLRGENLLGISVDDSREKVLAELGEPSMQDYYASGDICYRYHDVEMAFFKDSDSFWEVVFYGRGQRGKFRLPWFIKDKNRIRRNINYDNMIHLLEKNKIWYSLEKSVGDDDKRFIIRNGRMIFYDACDNGNFILHGLYLHRI
jgi:hypothetical protein